MYPEALLTAFTFTVTLPLAVFDTDLTVGIFKGTAYTVFDDAIDLFPLIALIVNL